MQTEQILAYAILPLWKHFVYGDFLLISELRYFLEKKFFAKLYFLILFFNLTPTPHKVWLKTFLKKPLYGLKYTIFNRNFTPPVG